MKSDRPKFQQRKIRLIAEAQRDTAINLLRNLPLDPVRPLEVVVREEVKARKLDQNAAMWAGPLRDIAEQAWVNGRQYSAEVWHESYKREFLPEEYDEGLCKEGYRKWDYTPKGDRVLIGSTTQLTVRGFAQYLEQVIADGASRGVMFTERPGRE